MAADPLGEAGGPMEEAADQDEELEPSPLDEAGGPGAEHAATEEESEDEIDEHAAAEEGQEGEDGPAELLHSSASIASLLEVFEDVVVASEAASAPPKKARNAKTAIVPAEAALELSDMHGEDGHLLRMFVERWEHQKTDARAQATDTWLIRGEFYDQMSQEFVDRYQLPLVVTDAHESELERQNLALEFGGVLTGRSPSAQLQSKLDKAGSDTYVLRDTLLQAVRQLTTPRRFLGKACSMPMTDEAKANLKLREGKQTRDIIMACLRGIYASDAGSEVLQLCVVAVNKSIRKFEARADDDVSQAMGGQQWSQLKDLVLDIENKLCVERGVPRNINQSAPEGRGTSRVLEQCLMDLGGAATLTEIFDWIESHQDALEKFKGVRLNQKDSKAKRKAGAEPIWKNTVRSALASKFQQGGRRGRSALWQLKGADPLPAADGTAAEDSGADGDDAAIEDEPADRPVDGIAALQDGSPAEVGEAELPEIPAKKRRKRETEPAVVPEFA